MALLADLQLGEYAKISALNVGCARIGRKDSGTPGCAKKRYIQPQETQQTSNILRALMSKDQETFLLPG